MNAMERLYEKFTPEPNTGCWLWTAGLRDGYGQMQFNGRMVGAHRISYILHRGPIREGLVLDHKCRQRCCVNPDHLEEVTNKENVLRGISFAAVNAAKTHCSNGHEYTAANTLIIKTGKNCRICTNLKKREWMMKRRRAAGQVPRVFLRTLTQEPSNAE